MAIGGMAATIITDWQPVELRDALEAVWTMVTTLGTTQTAR